MLSEKLRERNENSCELCNASEMYHALNVSPKMEDEIDNQVGVCSKCMDAIENNDKNYNWRVLESSIWSNVKSVQALSYRLLNQFNENTWATDCMNSVDIDEEVKEWALSYFKIEEIHKDAYGNKLENGDNVVLTQALDVKGTNFTASKGTVVRKIKLVSENTDQIEGKINEQSIVILTKFVRKN